MSDLLLEVDEEMRAQQIKALWDRYGQWVITLPVLVVIGSGLGVLWFNQKNAALEADTAKLVAALQSSSDSKVIASKLQSLKGETETPLNGVVGLYEAQTQEKNGELKAARASYNAIAAQMTQPSIVKQLAILQSVRLGILLQDNPDALLSTLDKLTEKNAPFRASALELKGVLLQQQNKTTEANKIFEGLASDMNVPGTLRQRAKAMIQYEGGDAK